jgi:hypothetical protein
MILNSRCSIGRVGTDFIEKWRVVEARFSSFVGKSVFSVVSLTVLQFHFINTGDL